MSSTDDGDGPVAPDAPTPVARDAYATTEPGGIATANRDTVVPNAPADSARTTAGSAGSASTTIDLPASGYQLGEVIGRGGMGEVISAHDQRIGRDVAIKRMRSASPSPNATARFLREARIQARLDHPAIVPVHELGTDAAGRPFFTMKRLAGVTLMQRLTEGGPIQPLLRAFVDVCLAIEFAHARGVVHRDLKPSNIMLGDYGEVYVLDWGVARVVGDKNRAPNEAPKADTLDEGTQAGELLGTPGYMAPEQVRGEDVGPAIDVYALGSILFEILVGDSLHPRGTAALTTTLSMPQQAPARRRPEGNIAPELDVACSAALAAEAAERPSARELADRIQRYLDGDRDIERRRELATKELELARAAIASGDPEARAQAMSSAGRALALDPASTQAAGLVTSLIVEPPRVLPKSAESELLADENRVAVQRLRLGAFGLVAVLGLSVLLPWLEIRNWTTLGAFIATILATAAAFWFTAYRRKPRIVIALAGTFALTLAFTRIIGPFMLTPSLIVAASVALSANPRLNARPGLIFGWLLACGFGSFALEAAGVFAKTWTITDQGVIGISAMFRGTGGSKIALVITNFAFMTLVSAYALFVNRQVLDARHRLRIQAWHLGQLLPAGRISVR